MSRLQNPHALVTEADVETATREKQDALKSYVGHPVCSVVQQADPTGKTSRSFGAYM
jgi:hypothetical protein